MFPLPHRHMHTIVAQDGVTPLMFALREDKTFYAEMLITANADLHLENKVLPGRGCGVHGVTRCNELVHVMRLMQLIKVM